MPTISISSSRTTLVYKTSPVPAEPSSAWRDAQVRLLDAGVRRPTSLEDAASTRGLRVLWRLFPDTWHVLLRERVACVRISGRATIADLLADGAVGELLPAHKHDRSVLARRASATRLRERLGGRRVVELTEEALLDVGRGRTWGSRKTWLKDVRFLRRIACRGHDLLGSTGRPARRWPWGFFGPEGAPDRRGLEPAQLTRILALLRPDEAYSLELVVAGRLLPSEMDRLRPEDLSPDGTRVVIRRGSRRGLKGRVEFRTVELPGWSRCSPPPRPSSVALRRGLRRAARKLGVRSISIMDLRSTGQATAWAGDGSRALVRGVIPVRGYGLETFQREQAALAASWPEPGSPPNSGRVVPSHAPPRCPVTASERGTARGGTAKAP